MSKFKRSWNLFKCSVRIVAQNRKLLLFPAIITLFMGVIALFFLAPIAFWQTGHAYGDMAHWQAVAQRWVIWDADGENVALKPASYALMASIYLISTFFATFFNVAFYSQIIEALRGRPVSISSGLRLAWNHINAILAWSLFTGVVGLLIRTLEERVGIFGRWIVGLIGLAWSVASVFVVPVIVVGPEGANPVQLLKTSATTLKRTWGESLLGYLGVRFGGLLAFMASLVLLGGSLWLSIAASNFWVMGVACVLWFVAFVAFMYLLSIASQVYLGALYLYAAEGMVPSPFDQDQMNMAWKIKTRRKGRV